MSKGVGTCGGHGSGFTLFIILFILLVIIGSAYLC
ncbi:YjcZ family sporulation protein [Sutcliffiella horikoshii]|nr:YjcZ family sporulation protein [Sutcliffiella horikoshii]MCM3616622.1 YjcZ family sporulation protein [Sutcliffiella horikoshii]